MIKRQDEVIRKTKNYVGSEEQVMSISSRSGEVASSKGSEKPRRSSYRSKVSGQGKTTSMTSSDVKKICCRLNQEQKRSRE